MQCKKTCAAALLAALCATGVCGGAALAAPLAPTPLISRNVPAYASSGNAQAANDANYRSTWRGRAPGWIAYDLSAVPAASRANIPLAWYGDSYDYDPSVFVRPNYGNLKDYVIEGNRAAGGTLPVDGWETVERVTGNIYHSRQHVFSFAGYNWVRVRVEAVDNAGSDTASVNIDVHDARQGLADDWIVYGDSITAGFGNLAGSPYGPPGQIVHAANEAYYPIFENGGTGSIHAAESEARMDAWLSVFPGRYVGIALGTNDAWGKPNGADAYYASMESIVRKVLAAGKVPVLAKIPWSAEPDVADNAPAYNAKIDELLRAYPAIRKGPDFWSIFYGKTDLLGGDGVHPSEKGYGIMRAAWAKTMLAEKRQGKSEAVTEALAQSAWAADGAAADAPQDTEENVDTSYLWAWGMAREERLAREKERHEETMKQRPNEDEEAYQARARRENERHEVNLQIIAHSK